MLRAENLGCGPKLVRFSMRRSAGIGISTSCWPHRRRCPCGSLRPTSLHGAPKCTSWWRCPVRELEDVVAQITPSGLLIETTVPPPAFEAGVEVVRLEIPYGRMRRRIELPAGSYALRRASARSRLPVSAPGGVKPMNTSEKPTAQAPPCRKMSSSFCRCAIWSSSPASCCRSPSAASTRSRPPRKPSARNAVSDWSYRRRPSDEPDPEELHQVGTAASIVRFVTAGDGTHHLIAQGEERFTRARLREPRSVLGCPHRASPGSHRHRPRDRSPRTQSCARRPSRRCSCCRRPRRNSPMPSAPSSRFRRSPTSWRASWT